MTDATLGTPNVVVALVDLADHCSHVAQQIVDRLELRKEAVGNKTRYVSAWFDDELTKLEGAE